MSTPLVEAVVNFLNSQLIAEGDYYTPAERTKSAKEHSDKHVAPYLSGESSMPSGHGETRVSDEHASKHENNQFHKTLTDAGYTKKKAVGHRSETIKKDLTHTYTKPGHVNIDVSFAHGKARHASYRHGRYDRYAGHKTDSDLKQGLDSGETKKVRRANAPYAHDW